MKKYLLLSILILITSWANAQMLNVPQKYQQYDQWCWAGCSQAIMEYYGIRVSQPQIAQLGSKGANNWIWLWGQSSNPYRSSIENILRNWRIGSSRVSSSLSYQNLVNEINRGRPVQVRWGWDNGGGHFVVCKGVQGNTVHIMDPWSGYTVNSYQWLVRGSGHTWTHTLKINK